VLKTLKNLKRGSPLGKEAEFWKWTSQGLVTYKDRVYVPEGEARKKIVVKYHNSPSTGHPGRKATLELLARDFYWPGMTAFINKYIEGCAECQQNKPIRQGTSPPLRPIEAARSSRPFAGISMDLIMDLPESSGYDAILVVVDQGLSKGVILCPCNKTVDALGIATLLRKNVYKRFGLPDYIISDRDPRFSSKLSEKLAEVLGYQQKLSTAYHPQTDGQTERMNQELEIYLRIFTGSNPGEWSEHLDMAEFTINNKPHSSKGVSPFYIIIGTNPKAFPNISTPTNIPSLEERIKQITNI
jgi:hypothetical protein